MPCSKVCHNAGPWDPPCLTNYAYGLDQSLLPELGRMLFVDSYWIQA